MLYIFFIPQRICRQFTFKWVTFILNKTKTISNTLRDIPGVILFKSDREKAAGSSCAKNAEIYCYG
jgi:hypothetical protein